MSSPFDPGPGSPFDPSGGSVFEAMTGPLELLGAAIDAVLGVDPMILSDRAKVASLVELERQTRRLPGCRHPLVAEIDACGVADTHQMRSTAVLLRDLLRLSTGEAHAWVKQAGEQVGKRDLTTGQPRPARLPAVAAAVRDGALSNEQQTLIAKTIREVPGAVSPGAA